MDAPQPSPVLLALPATIQEQQPLESTIDHQEQPPASGLSTTQLPKVTTQSRRRKLMVQFDVCPMPLVPPQQQENQEVVNAHITNNIDHNHHVMPLGRPYPHPVSQQGIILSVAPHDHSMARLYKACDSAGAPKYLCNQFITILLQAESLHNPFDLMDPLISKPRTYFPRVQRQLGIPGPQCIPLTLESGQKVVVYRFDFMERLQRHLLSHAFSDLNNLSLPDPSNPWNSMVEQIDYSSSTRSQWYHGTCKKYRTQLEESGNYMLHPLTLYIDKTKNCLQNMPAACALILLPAPALR
jgi:hypothetical protein